MFAFGLTFSPLAEPLQATEFDPSNGLGLAESMLTKEKYMEAGKLAQRVLKSEPDNQRAHLILGKAYFGVGALDLAQKQVKTLLENDEPQAEYHLLDGMIKMFQGKPAQSVAALETAFQISKETQTNPAQASILNTLILAYHKAEQPKQALKAAVNGLEAYPEEPQLYLTCSRLYREKGDFSSALSVAEKGISKHPSFSSLYASIALAHKGLGQKEEMESAYQSLLDRNPELAESLRKVLDDKESDKADYQIWVE